MKSEYIGKQPTFEVRTKSLKERTENFFSTYNNPSGSEDRLEIFLIREGYRAVLLAEEEIKRLKEENAKLQTSIGLTSDKYRVGRIKAETLKEFSERLKKEAFEIEESEVDVVDVETVDDLVKEMVGETDD